MAIITGLKNAKVGHESETATVVFYESELQTVATGTTVDVSGLNPHFSHWFASVPMYNVGGVQVVGGAGTFAVLVATWVNGVLEAPPTASITAAAPVTIDWSGPTARVQVILTGAITGVTWVLRLAAVRD